MRTPERGSAAAMADALSHPSADNGGDGGEEQDDGHVDLTFREALGRFDV